MSIFKEASSRIRTRQWDENIKAKRHADFMEALERLEHEEYLAHMPDHPNPVARLEEIRRTKAEIVSMMDQEFGLSEQYKQIADS